MKQNSYRRGRKRFLFSRAAGTIAAWGAALALSACGYHTYITPSPTQVHQGEPIPVRLAVTVTGGGASKDLSRAFMGKTDQAVRDYLVEYFQKTRLFGQVDSIFPGDVELFVTLVKVQPKVDESSLQSRQSSIETSVQAQYKAFSRFLPNLVVAGEASGFGSVRTSASLTVGDYEDAMGQALSRVAAAMYGEISEKLLAEKAAIMAWASERKTAPPDGKAPPQEKSSEKKKDKGSEKNESGWEEVNPVVVDKKP